MIEALSLKQHLMLQSWMSAAFPIGAYSCSHGLETAIQDDRIDDSESCLAWILDIASQGSGWNDSIIMANAHSITRQLLDNDPEAATRLCELNDLALALQAGSERYLETSRLAAAFLQSSSVWGTFEQIPWQAMGPELALPVVIGALGAAHRIPPTILIASALQSMTSNLAWIATRLVPLGQTSCLQTIATLEPQIVTIAERATLASLDDLGSCTLLADLASLQHEQLTGRVCQT
ncbi:urease accessory protein UreF [Granulosicoccus antarcticus]|uniref:Urease accessory protein UreF n=1 Tax=Granulosicoccus antarcticus IMCC3135 TaxID=1192854 RepID=A0A2Z2NMB8_9GAMM|nr:urease accessory UreF family protein [Granulosicoccus antarcticus]ASJ72496.1 Urease accessory protein UreF [Granulosicoccus antarcticus IMCC3135]